jgi:hypothetical protein
VAVAIRGRGLVSFMVAAATVGVALLMDLRGLAWGLACGGALALAALREDRKGGALRLALLLGGLSASYAAGEAAYGDLGVSLEERGDVHRLEMETGRAPPELPKPPPVDRGYIWGRTPLRQLPDTLATLVASARAAPAEGFVARDLAFAGAQHDAMQAAIAGFAGFAVLVGAVGLRRRPWQALAWFGTSLPFAACTWAALRMVSWHPRFLLLGLPALAVGMGVALATLCLAGDRQESGGRIGWLHLALVGVLAWALPMSWIPSPLSVRAGWQSPYGADEEPLQLWRQAVAGSQGAPRDAECRGYLRADADRGIEPSLWGDPLR